MAQQGEPMSTKTPRCLYRRHIEEQLCSTNPITDVVDVDVEWEYSIDGVENDRSSSYGIAAASPDGVVIVARHSTSADVQIFRRLMG